MKPVIDYTEWCDEIMLALASWLQQQRYGLNGHLDSFAQEYLDKRGLPLSALPAVTDAVLDVFGAFGLPDDTKLVQLEHGQLPILTDTRGRWEATFELEIDKSERALIEAVNQLSVIEDAGVFRVSEVPLAQLLQHPLVQHLLSDHPHDHVLEMLGALKRHRLIEWDRRFDGGSVNATYCGFARLGRTQILVDGEVDKLRVQGESEGLDYKRILDLSSRKAKMDFAKDVVAFANAVGPSPKIILVGVDDDGTFHRPENPDAHRQAVHGLKDTTLQQIVNERTLHAPSVTIRARGDHRDGPYTLIEIESDLGYAPYRFFPNPTDSREPGAAAVGEVWVRKGTTKHHASPDEVAELERRAALYRELFPGR